MDPSTAQRIRRLTAVLAVAWALLALVNSLSLQIRGGPDHVPPMSLSQLAGVTTVVWASPAARGLGVRPGDRVLEIDALHAQRWWRHGGLQRLREGVVNRYELERRDGERYTVALAPLDRAHSPQVLDFPLYLALVFVGGIYLLIGVIVWRLKPERRETLALLLFCSAMAMQLFSAWETENQFFYYERILANLGLIGASAFHFFTLFPSEPPWLVRHSRIRYVPYLAAGVVAFLAATDELLGIPPGLVANAAFLLAIGLALVSIGVLAWERLRQRRSLQAQRADAVLLGFAVSFLPALAVLVAQVFLRVSLPVLFALLWFAVFPLVVGYAVVRRELFDIRMAARSSVVYGVVTLGITGLFASVIAFADLLVWRFNVNARSPVFQVGFLFFAILLFNPIRSRLQDWVDRTFDRDRARYRQAVREISEAMVSMLSISEVVDRILIAVTETMAVERSLVLLLDDDRKVFSLAASRGDWDRHVLEATIPADHPIVKQLWMRREELLRSDFADEPDPETRDACRDVFDTLEVQLLVPILFGVDLIGAIGVGPKLSGDRLSPDDRQLLRTLANQSSIAIENAKAFDEIAALNETLEARVEERTEELRRTQAQLIQNEKMVSLGQLVAGVAHELNNPIGFVHANLQLIEGYLDKLLRLAPGDDPDVQRVSGALGKLINRSREGTQRVKQIVADLRAFSRLDQAEVQRVDLHEGIERTLSLMEPRLKGGIEVVRDYGQLPQVRCFAGQLNQVFMNLLVNACDALEGQGGSIRIRTRPTPEGVRLEFSDDGPGIPAEIQNRLFEPFFTTKEVGKGTGLGLSLSHGIVERHGGTIRVDSEVSAGATFVLELPLDAAPDAD